MEITKGSTEEGVCGHKWSRAAGGHGPCTIIFFSFFTTTYTIRSVVTFVD